MATEEQQVQYQHMMPRRILLTGSNGLLGQKIVNLLSNRMNVQLLATSKGVNRHSLHEGYTYRTADLLDQEIWESIFQEFKPTDIIHSAALTNVDYCEKEKELCDQVNVQAVSMLCELCKRYDTRMMFISTDFIFDGNDGPYRENDLPNPVNYYGLSKLKAEEIIQRSGVSYAILRTILLYGITSGMSRGNIVLWAKKSLEEGKNLRIVNDQIRCPTLAEDLASATVSCLMKNAEGIFHISGPEMLSMVELVKKVANFWKLDDSLISEINSNELDQLAKRPPKTGFVLLKAQTELNFKPHNLKKGFLMLDRQLREIV